MIMLSRNCPSALIVGVAGFMGSHLAEKLLEKGIQVIGIDDLSLGKKENIEDASKNKNFHFLNQNAANHLQLDLPRLDYAFFMISEHAPEYIYRASWENFLKICATENLKPKIILVSSIDLYDGSREGLGNLKFAEKGLASFAIENKANARVIRLAAVFGPRMHFRESDPICRLIQTAALDKLQKEQAPLDFTTRSLYIADAVDLIIKAFMHGATAQKIYDGCLFHPVKISEIREILLDPLWYESKSFTPTQLPPWPTPNLLKTEKELAWKPNVNFVTALKLTYLFFKENPAWVKEEEKIGGSQVAQTSPKDPLIKEEMEKEIKKEEKPLQPKKKRNLGTFVWGILILSLVAFALAYPIFKLAWTAFEIKNYLEKGLISLEGGDFTQAEKQARQAKDGVEKIEKAFEPILAITEVGVFGQSFQDGRKMVLGISETIDAMSYWTQGIKSLEEGFGVMSGAKEGDLEKIFTEANFNLDQAEKKLQNIPEPLKGEIVKYQKAVVESKKGAMVISQLVPVKGSKSYLILLVDNQTLRPGGGLIKAFAQVDFKEGKLIAINTGNIEDLEKDFKENINFPADFKQDFAGKKLTLQDLSFETDFTENAKLIQWVYKGATGKQVSGVISLDFDAVEAILKTEIGVGSEAKVLEEVLQKIFFLSGQNWTSLGRSLGQSLLSKHILIFVADPTLFSYLNLNGWSGTMPRQAKEDIGERREFLAFVQTNITGGQNLQKVVDLHSGIDQNNRVSHKLTINITNQNPTLDSQNRLKFYLPSGTRLTKALWGERNVSKEVTSFADYGHAGYSILLALRAKENKSIILEYEDQKPLEFQEGKVKYSLDVVKQPGVGKDNFNFKLRFPSGFKVISWEGEQKIPQEVSFTTTLEKDRKFEVVLEK